MKAVLLAALLTLGLVTSAQNYQKFDMYPNPANEMMWVQVPGNFLGITNIYVTDMLGRVVWTNQRNFDELDNRKIEVRVDDFIPGYYILNIRNNDDWRAQKFVKR